MATLTEFGKQVKIKLIQMDKPQKWLNEEVIKGQIVNFSH